MNTDELRSVVFDKMHEADIESRDTGNSQLTREWCKGYITACLEVLRLLPEPLKPCPFCGCKPGRTDEYDEEEGVVLTGDNAASWVTCHNCHTDGPRHETEAEALAAWNTRKEPTP